MAFKLDMSKAYDRVEWAFLRAIMIQLGFSDPWTERVMSCINSVSYSVKVNGWLSPCVKPERGLRQGDPLSPYLFLLVGEAFSALLDKADSMGMISGISINRRGPSVSHLFFADDSILFAKSDTMEATNLKNIMNIYEHASGESINASKSSVFFSPNTSRDQGDAILLT